MKNVYVVISYNDILGIFSSNKEAELYLHELQENSNLSPNVDIQKVELFTKAKDMLKKDEENMIRKKEKENKIRELYREIEQIKKEIEDN